MFLCVAPPQRHLLPPPPGALFATCGSMPASGDRCRPGATVPAGGTLQLRLGGGGGGPGVHLRLAEDTGDVKVPRQGRGGMRGGGVGGWGSMGETLSQIPRSCGLVAFPIRHRTKRLFIGTQSPTAGIQYIFDTETDCNPPSGGGCQLAAPIQ